jgi:hypothetical protein
MAKPVVDDDDDVKARARKRAKARMQSAWYKLTPNSDNVFRILPTPRGKTSSKVFFEYNVHRDVGPMKKQVRCGKDAETGEGRCWLCDVKIPALMAAKKGSRATALAPSLTLVFQIAEVEDDGSFNGPKIWSPAKGVGDQLLATVLGSKKKVYEDPKKGYNISLHRTGSGRNDTKYGLLQPDEDPTEVPAKIIAKLKPFDELKEIPVYDEARQKAAYTGQESIEEEDDEEEEVEETPAPKAKRRSKPEPEEEEEDDEEEDDEEEDGEEEDKSDSEDDDSGEDDDDEEEVLPPPKKKGKVAPPPPPPAKRKAKPEPEPEEEEDKEEEEDEEDDADDIDLDEADDDTEDEDDEPPPSKVKKPVMPVKKGRK